MSEVLILGGGFGGLAAATTLRGLLERDDRITLVAHDDIFYMGFAKLWDLGGERPLRDGTRPLAALERNGIHFEHADIIEIDQAAHEVETDQGTLRGDGLIIALGADRAQAQRAMLATTDAYDLYDAGALPAMHTALDGIAGGRVVVAILGAPYQCPPAPYEAALLVADRLRGRGVDVTMVTPQPMTLPVAGPDASRYVADHLDQHGVELLAEHVVTAVEDHVITFADGAELAFDVLLGVPATSPLPVLGDWLEVDRHTLRTTDERVYAVGDCTHVPTTNGALPKAGVFAAAEGEVAARNLAADLGHGDPTTFDGRGFCFLELPGRRVAFVEGDWYAEPPHVELAEADEAQFERKVAYERERLDTWLP